MEDIFLKLIVNDLNSLLIKFLIVPVIFIFYYFVLLFFSRRKISSTLKLDNFIVSHQFSKIYSCCFSVLILNAYWYFLLRFNGLNKFDWSFTYEITNIYLQLSPFLLANLLLIYIYVKSKDKLNNII